MFLRAQIKTAAKIILLAFIEVLDSQRKAPEQAKIFPRLWRLSFAKVLYTV
jgi:hypothetical protein